MTRRSRCPNCSQEHDPGVVRCARCGYSWGIGLRRATGHSAPISIAEHQNSLRTRVEYRDVRAGDPGQFSMSVAFLPYVDVLSVELGILMARLDARPEKWGGTYHAKNEAMILRIAAAGGYRADIEASGDPAWLFIDFDRRT